MRAGLVSLADAPLRSGYLEGLATWAPDEGAMARLEAGLVPFRDTSIFAFAQWGAHSGPLAGVGARYSFRL